MSVFPVAGEVVWIGLRPSRNEPMVSVNEARVDEKQGLLGDRYAGSSGNRHLTLIQWEHLAVIEALTGRSIAPEILRRNLVVKGINLVALKNHRINIGNAIVQITGYCHPCSKMESKLGTGGYNAMRGHGGVTARVIKAGVISISDAITVCLD
ncbi:MAG: MOSC domain-containing protein [Methylococcaceae bacterium]|nr:MOSC domain-containing protein [Methylococcaceae bacterium]